VHTLKPPQDKALKLALDITHVMCPCKFWNRPNRFDGLFDSSDGNWIMTYTPDQIRRRISDGLMSDGYVLMALKGYTD
jgi:hypothetical protein